MSVGRIMLFLVVALISILVGLIAALIVAGIIIVILVILAFDGAVSMDIVQIFLFALIPGLITWLLTTLWYFRRNHKNYEQSLRKIVTAFTSGEFWWPGAFVGGAIVGGLISFSEIGRNIAGSGGIMWTVAAVLCVIVGGVIGGLWHHPGILR